MSRTEVTWTDANGKVTVPGMIEDKSVFGLGIQIAKPIPVGSVITVKFSNRLIEGVVRRCTKDGLSTLIGVQFESAIEPTST